MQNHLRICFVSYKFSPAIGGAEARAEKQARQLQAFGHHVTIVTLCLHKTWKRLETIEGLPIVRVGGIYGSGGVLRLGRLGHFFIDIGMLVTLWRLRHQYDVIHAFQITSQAAVASLVGQILGKPVVISAQNTGPSHEQRMVLEQKATLMADTLINRDFLKIDFSDWMVGGSEVDNLPYVAFGGHLILKFLRKSNVFYQVLSTRGYTYLVSHGFKAEHIVHIPGSVDTEKFRPAIEQHPEARSVERTIICVARLEYSKGIDVLLHGWGRMIDSSSTAFPSLNPRLYIVGDGKLRPQLERIVAEPGIQESVEFLGKRKDIVNLLQQAWGFVLPSRWEGMPNALLEAMACALPCVATCVSGSEDIIVDGINGLLVEPEQPAEIAQALQRLLQDANLALRLGKAGRATVIRDYQLSHVVEQCLNLYHSLLNKGSHLSPFALKGANND